jgi:hypothetical protein
MRLEAKSRETNNAVIAVEKDGARAATIHQIDAALRLASKNKGPGDRRRPNPLASVEIRNLVNPQKYAGLEHAASRPTLFTHQA